jgi:DNA-binding winged helix-turn-helix (wHTH) protein
MPVANSTTAPTINAYQIASDIVLNTHTNSLSNKGVIIELENRLVSLLIYFINHQNDVLHKEHLLKTIWHGKVVNDDSLAVAVSYLRKALGDNSRAPQFIKTIPGVGYQFIAEVKPLSQRTEHEFKSITSATTPASPTQKKLGCLYALAQASY